MLSCEAACVSMYALYWSIQLQSCKCVSINLLLLWRQKYPNLYLYRIDYKRNNKLEYTPITRQTCGEAPCQLRSAIRLPLAFITSSPIGFQTMDIGASLEMGVVAFAANLMCVIGKLNLATSKWRNVVAAAVTCFGFAASSISLLFAISSCLSGYLLSYTVQQIFSLKYVVASEAVWQVRRPPYQSNEIWAVDSRENH